MILHDVLSVSLIAPEYSQSPIPLTLKLNQYHWFLLLSQMFVVFSLHTIHLLGYSFCYDKINHFFIFGVLASYAISVLVKLPEIANI